MADYQKINSDLGSINWLNLFNNNNDIDYNVPKFYSLLLPLRLINLSPLIKNIPHHILFGLVINLNV